MEGSGETYWWLRHRQCHCQRMFWRQVCGTSLPRIKQKWRPWKNKTTQHDANWLK